MTKRELPPEVIVGDWCRKAKSRHLDPNDPNAARIFLGLATILLPFWLPIALAWLAVWSIGWCVQKCVKKLVRRDVL